MLTIGRERWVWVTALIVAERIRVMPAKHLKLLAPIK